MTIVHANIHIGESEDSPYPYYWTVEVLEIVCATHKTESSARRAAIRWCKRVGFAYTVTVDKDARS